MNTLPISAATNGSARKTSSEPASAVPTSTGAIAAGSVRGRAAMSQIRSGTARPTPVTVRWSRAAGELREVGLASLHVGVPPLLGFIGHVEEEVRVVGQLLETGK